MKKHFNFFSSELKYLKTSRKVKILISTSKVPQFQQSSNYDDLKMFLWSLVIHIFQNIVNYCTFSTIALERFDKFQKISKKLIRTNSESFWCISQFKYYRRCWNTGNYYISYLNILKTKKNLSYYLIDILDEWHIDKCKEMKKKCAHISE